MTNYDDKRNRPFSYTIGYSKKIASGAVDTQLIRMPWQTPGNRPGLLTYAAITNPVGTVGRLDIWDQDASNTTPPTGGSAGASLIPLEFGASGLSGAASETTIYRSEDLPKKVFVAGLNAQSTLPGVTVMFDITYI